MKRKIFLRFFLVTLLTTLLTFVCGIIAVNMNAKNMIKERLIAEAELSSTLLEGVDDFSRFDEYTNKNAFRITIIDTSGKVLYESDTKAEMENHADREEFGYAMEGKSRTIERYSETFKCKMTYYAVKTTLDDGTDVVLRLAVKSSQISSYIGVSIPLMIFVWLVVLGISLYLSNLISAHVSKRITQVGDSLKRLNSGEYQPLKVDSSEPEFYTVFNEINDLNAKAYAQTLEGEQERLKLSAVLDNVSQGIIALNERKDVVFVNQWALELFNGRITEKDKGLIFLIENLDLYGKIERHLHENYTFECDYKDRGLAVSIVKIEDERLRGVITDIVIVTDITGEKEIVRQKSDFFANASHELKTPITVMQGLAELLMEKKELDEQSKKFVTRIYKENARLNSLISDMLKLSNLERGEEMGTAYSAFDIRNIADEVVEDLAERIQKKGITVTVEGNGVIEAETKRIYELIENLCTNAINYNKENGSIAVTISEEMNFVVLTVKDTGIGIEKEHLPRLCERFYRVDKSRSKKTGGTGLGLAIVKHICALYDAKLSIESEIDVGTEVKVYFKKK